LDAREIDGTALLVTEFIDGLDLGQMVQRVGGLEIADACEIVRQIADALQYTSDQGFVHRDVKPSNIMISQAGEVKLLDLGLARLQFGDSESTEITGTGQTMGTADYISPEQVTDSRKVDVRSDIYSLGATLYRLLSGRAPFVGDKYMTAFAKMTAHVSASPANLRTLRADVPIELERLVTRMLSKRPEDRPQSPNEVAIKLSEFTRGCELKGLVQQTMSITPSSTPKAEAASTSKKTTIPQTQSFLHRPVAVYKAIAAGFFGMIVGLCFGILITITNPDGSKTTLSIPDGSKLEIAESGNKSNPLNSIGQVPETSMTAPPLQFALMVNKEDSGKAPFISDNDLTKLLEQLSRTNRNAVVQNDVARFVRIPPVPGVEIPICDWNDGILYALVSTDPRYSIGWDEIEGRILESNAPKDANKQAVLTLKFDKTLGEKMSRLSSAGIGQQLAIMVDNVVVQSPKINSTISTDVSITGIFSPSQVQNMRLYFSR
jgi:serine/threonine protein kinase